MRVASGLKLETPRRIVRVGAGIVSTSSRNYHGVQDWIGETGFSRARLRSLGATRLFVFPSRKLVLSPLFQRAPPMKNSTRRIKRNRVNRLGGLRKNCPDPRASIRTVPRLLRGIRVCFPFYFVRKYRVLLSHHTARCSAIAEQRSLVCEQLRVLPRRKLMRISMAGLVYRWKLCKRFFIVF